MPKYRSEMTNQVAAILAEATGRTVLDYAREKLFGPLGITTRPAYGGQALSDPTSEEPTQGFLKAGFAWGTDRQASTAAAAS